MSSAARPATPSGGRRRRLAPLVLCTTLLALLAPRQARAQPPPAGAARPFDAPSIPQEASLPPLPPEYLTHDESGIQFAYHPSTRDRVRALIEMAAAVRLELAHLLGRDDMGTVQVRVAITGADLLRVVPEGTAAGSPALAITRRCEGDEPCRLLIMSLGVGGGADSTTMFRHGMAHLALDAIVGDTQVPRWLHEGLAVSFSGQEGMGRRRALWWATLQRTLIPLDDLDWHMRERRHASSVPVAQAADLVGFLSADDAHPRFLRLLEALRGGTNFDDAFRVAFEQDQAQIEQAWREDIAKHKAFVPILLAGTLLWVVVALGARARRRWGRRTTTTRQPTREPVRSTRPVSARSASARASARDATPGDDLPMLPPEQEPGVPKVSHDGRWHTLH